MKHPNKLDWLIYSIFRIVWNPILRKNKKLSLAISNEMVTYWGKQERGRAQIFGEIKDHKHEFYLDSEVVFTDDGEPQPRSSIFLECFSGNDKDQRYCPFILRDNEIVDYINELLDKLESK